MGLIYIVREYTGKNLLCYNYFLKKVINLKPCLFNKFHSFNKVWECLKSVIDIIIIFVWMSYYFKI